MNWPCATTHLELVHRTLRDWPLRRTYALLWPDMEHVTAVATVLRRCAVRPTFCVPWMA
ncbi:hypothetical protein [Streptomyces sp. NBC_01320]|uniref:hypothetical protein n=1 Tax=Streptomyces sp. NBC_01320 TaxID=2903824 RepID=UPI002E0DBDCF|nr:hypothetical protein OG395_57045 [Streptomyces sp. NBC_01320]